MFKVCLFNVRRRNHLTVTRKAPAFPASSARQPCCVVTLQPVTHSHNSPAAVWRLGQKPRHCGEMVLLTMIARLADGLPLAASMQEDEQVKTQKKNPPKQTSVFPAGSFAASLMSLRASVQVSTLAFLSLKQRRRHPRLHP